MTLHEEGGKVAQSAISALKGNPLCITVLLLVIVLSVIAYWRESAEQKSRSHSIDALIERCMEPAKR